MKKILSISLTLCMLLSLAAALSIPAAAVDGQWTVLGDAPEYQEGFDEEPRSLPGYEYTDEGFHLIPTDAWKESNPYVSVQTKDKVDLKDGVYLEVRIDNFTYSSDKWFNLHIWDSVALKPGSSDPTYGAGVQNLIRPNDGGKVNGAEWFIKEFTRVNSTTFAKDKNPTSEKGQPILCLTVTWDGKTYAVDINGGGAPQGVIDYMNEKWGGNDSMAYIGINAQNANKGGTVEFTILKFGTSKDSATIPMGDDSEQPTNELIPIAEIASPDTVPANQPAIFMNADRVNSDTKGRLFASNGGYSTINDDFSVHVIADSTVVTAANYTVKNEVSYDLKDFPIAITLTRNFCTCGNEDGSCDALESAYYYIMAGDILAAYGQYKTAVLEMSYNSYTINDDTYLYFFCDFSSEFGNPMEGRVNGIRFDAANIDLETEGGNTFDVMFTAFFRTVEEAEAFVLNYVKELGWTDETEAPTTEESTEETTEETTAKETEPVTDEATTEKVEVTTEATEDEKESAPTPAENGCASVVGLSSVAAAIAIAAGGMMTFRKKRD